MNSDMPHVVIILFIAKAFFYSFLLSISLVSLSILPLSQVKLTQFNPPPSHHSNPSNIQAKKQVMVVLGNASLKVGLAGDGFGRFGGAWWFCLLKVVSC